MAISRTKSFAYIFLGVVVGFYCLMGCSRSQRPILGEPALLPPGGSIAIIGFKPAFSTTAKPRTQSPITDTAYRADQVEDEIADQLNMSLFSILKKSRPSGLVLPYKAKEAYTDIVSSRPDQREIDVLVQVGRLFSVDTLLSGYIYRWQEREGGEYSVIRPASVAFDLYLISTGDKVILWRGIFDKSQRSLSENLLDLKFFLKSKGRWLTAMELAEIGLTEMLEEID